MVVNLLFQLYINWFWNFGRWEFVITFKTWPDKGSLQQEAHIKIQRYFVSYWRACVRNWLQLVESDSWQLPDSCESSTLWLCKSGSHRHRCRKFSFKHSIADSPSRRIGDSPTRRVGELVLPHSTSQGVIFRLRISPRIRSQNRNGLKCSVTDLCWTDLCKNLIAMSL